MIFGKPKSVSILFCSSWRSTQSHNVPFELEWFQSFPLIAGSRFAKWKDFSKVWKEKGFKWLSYFFSLLSSCFWSCIICVFCFLVLSQPSFMHCFVYHVFVCLFFSFALFCFSKKKKWKIRKIQKQCVFVYIGTCVPWMAIETNFSKLCISCSLDEHLYHHYGAAGHTRPNCNKWLATQQSNNIITSGNQN